MVPEMQNSIEDIEERRFGDHFDFSEEKETESEILRMIQALPNLTVLIIGGVNNVFEAEGPSMLHQRVKLKLNLYDLFIFFHRPIFC